MNFRFGGTDGQYHYNDTWLFSTNSRTWGQLDCNGYIPVPREGHGAAMVDDMMYVYGGRGADGMFLQDLVGFQVSSKQTDLHCLDVKFRIFFVTMGFGYSRANVRF